MQVGEGLWVLCICSSLKCAAVGWVEGEPGEAALCNIQSREEWQLCPQELLVLELVRKGRQ